MSLLVDHFPDAVRGLEADCIEAAVAKLRNSPPHDGAQPAFWVLRGLLGRASSFLGQTFINAGGPDLLLDYMRSGCCRNPALTTVLRISCNSGNLANVVDMLGMHVDDGDLPKLCEDYPPVGGDDALRMKLLSAFTQAFGRPPNW